MIANPEFPCSGEELSVFVEANGHYPIRSVECFFDTIAVVHIDVDI